MRTLDRYIALLFIKNVFLSVAALVALFFTQGLLGDLLDHEFTPHQVVYHLWLQVPQMFVQMTPPAVLIGTVLTLAGLNRSNELTACYSIGIGIRRIGVTFLSIVVVVCVGMYFLQDKVLPVLFKKRTTYFYREMKKQSDFYLDVKQNKIWYRSKNLIYNLQSFDPKTQHIKGMSVYTFDEKFNLVQVVDAKESEYTSHGWKLKNGRVTLFKKEDPFPVSQQFVEKDLDIQETPKEFQEIEKEVDGLQLSELGTYIQKIRDAGSDTKSYEVKWHSRLSQSFISLVMCILGVPFSVRNRREGSVARDIGLCLVTTFFYWLFYSIGLSLGTNGAVPPALAAWLPTAIFGILALFLVSRIRL